MGEPRAGLKLNGEEMTATINVADLVGNIANDIEQGLDKSLIIQYWTTKLGQEQQQEQESPSPRSSNRSRIQIIREADRDTIIEMLAGVVESYSYSSIARCIFGDLSCEVASSRGYAVKKWTRGLLTPTASSIEKVRAFLIGLEHGEFSDVLAAPGGNRST